MHSKRQREREGDRERETESGRKRRGDRERKREREKDNAQAVCGCWSNREWSACYTVTVAHRPKVCTSVHASLVGVCGGENVQRARADVTGRACGES
jgi:hypothetical protein